MNHELFDWDFENISHIARHGVSPEDAEFVLTSDPLELDVEQVGYEERFRCVGMTSNGNVLIVIYTFRRERLRVVTAYPASATLTKAFLKWRSE